MRGRTIALAWLLFSGFMVLLVFVQNLSTGTAIDWREGVGGRLLHGMIWALLTPMVFFLAARFNVTERRHRLRHLLLHAAASYALTLLYRRMYELVMHGLASGGQPLRLSDIIANANNWVPIYWMLLCIGYAVQYYERYRQRSLEAARLEVQLAQVNSFSDQRQLFASLLRANLYAPM